MKAGVCAGWSSSVICAISINLWNVTSVKPRKINNFLIVGLFETYFAAFSILGSTKARVVASGTYCLPRTETWEGGISYAAIVATTILVVVIFNSMVLLKMKRILAEENLRFITIKLLLLVSIYFVQYGVYVMGVFYEWITGYYMHPVFDILSGTTTYVSFFFFICGFSHFIFRSVHFWTLLYIFGQVRKFSDLPKK